MNRDAKPRVTIGICVHNGAKTLGKAIESISTQDFPHELMEILFVDDGSEDETLSSMKDAAMKIGMKASIFHHDWRGLGPTRNVVVRKAAGDFIVWVDGDMILSPRYIRTMVDYMDHNQDVGVAKGRFSTSIAGNWIALLELYSRAASKMVDFDYKSKKDSKALGTGGSIYRTAIIRQIGGFDEEILGYGEDWDVEYRIRTAGWSLRVVDAEFHDRESLRIRWSELWSSYFKRGYDLHFFSRKNKGMLSLTRMLPPSSLLAGFFHSLKIYPLVHRKIVFLLPLEYLFKSTAWCVGYAHAS
jgi:glycosyltransferase involved in cell wall biosynthesis